MCFGRFCTSDGFVAEREGFEPSVQLPVRQFSKLFLSASQASLLITPVEYSGAKIAESAQIKQAGVENSSPIPFPRHPIAPAPAQFTTGHAVSFSTFFIFDA